MDVSRIEYYNKGSMKDFRNDYYVYYFTALSWCGPCKQMHSTVWPNPQIKAKLKLFKRGELIVFNDEERLDPDVEKFYRYFEVTSVPTIIIVDQKANVIKRAVGMQSVQQVLDLLEAK